MKLAIIDLGTNSVRFDIYDLNKKKPPKRIHREKQMVRLGEGVFRSGRLKTTAKNRTFEALEGFQEQIENEGVDRVVAFATSALRDAKDAERFLREVKKRTEIRIRVITGKQEAELIAKGILSNEDQLPSQFALVDIGGGSTEVGICRGSLLEDCYSFDLGAARLQQVFLRGNPPRPYYKQDPILRLREHIASEVTRVMRRRKWPEVKTVVGSSGTIKALRRLIRKTGSKAQPFKRKTLGELIEELESLSVRQLLRIPGMEAKRVDIILSGAILLHELMIQLGATRVLTSEYSMRDGVLEREIERLRR